MGDTGRHLWEFLVNDLITESHNLVPKTRYLNQGSVLSNALEEERQSWCKVITWKGLGVQNMFWRKVQVVPISFVCYHIKNMAFYGIRLYDEKRRFLLWLKLHLFVCHLYAKISSVQVCSNKLLCHRWCAVFSSMSLFDLYTTCTMH